MKCPIVFRGIFRDPKGPLDTGGFRLPGNVIVEIYQEAVGPPAEWRARRPGTKNDFKITPQSAYKTLQNQISGLCFGVTVTPWQAFDSAQYPARPLFEDEWLTTADGKPFLTDAYLEKLKAEKTAADVAAKAARPSTESFFE